MIDQLQKNFKVTQKKNPPIAAERFNNQTNSDQFFLRISDLQSHVKQRNSMKYK